MRIVLVGYGKMGRSLEKIASGRGHEIAAIVRDKNYVKNLAPNSFDVALEFTNPASAYDNIITLLDKSIPVVSGTTGWNKELTKAVAQSNESGTPFFFASNFSIGMNITFAINRKLAQMTNRYDLGGVSIQEHHHTEKKDSPSGTAVSMAEDIIAETDYAQWHNHPEILDNSLPIVSHRTPGIVGRHKATYRLPKEEITIEHTAKDREIFALGAIVAAEYLQGKTGYHTMENMMTI